MNQKLKECMEGKFEKKILPFFGSMEILMKNSLP